MRPVLSLLATVILALSPSTAEAQAEYFTGGESVAGGEASFVRADEQRGLGVGVEALFSPRLGVAVSYARSTFQQPDGRFGEGETLDASAFTLGLQLYPSRQGLDQPITTGLGLGVGRTQGATTFNAAILVARAIAATGDGPGFQLVPKVEAALSVALAGGTTVSAQTLSAGIGIAGEVARGAFVFVEPTVAVAIAQDESQTFVGGTFGFVVALQ